MLWTIVLIGAGLSSSSITYVGQFEQASEAYSLMAEGKCGKVAIVFDEEVK